MNAQIGDQWRISRAEQMRRAMGPEFCAIADALRKTFGDIKGLDWLKTDALTMGTEPGGICTKWDGVRKGTGP